jgi:hypothetical protein
LENKNCGNNIIKKVLLITGILLLLISSARFWTTLQRGIMHEAGPITAMGELVANFPMYPVLEHINPVLFESVQDSCVAWHSNYDGCFLDLESHTSLFLSAKNKCDPLFPNKSSGNNVGKEYIEHIWSNEASSGELFVNFPKYPVLQEYYRTLFELDKSTETTWLVTRFGCNLPNYNPTLYESAKNTNTAWFSANKEWRAKWFYGPFHHLVHFPILQFYNLPILLLPL